MIYSDIYDEVSKEKLSEFIQRAIYLLIDGQVSETIILSSHKINRILQEKCGQNFKIDKIGRALARYAKQNKLKKMETSVPKYVLEKSKLKSLSISDS